MTFDEIKQFLLDAGVPSHTAQIYASTLNEYVEATANIQKTGAVVANPRTGAPMDNPYLKVRDAAAKRLEGYSPKRIPCIPELWSRLFPPAAAKPAKKKS